MVTPKKIKGLLDPVTRAKKSAAENTLKVKLPTVNLFP